VDELGGNRLSGRKARATTGIVVAKLALWAAATSSITHVLDPLWPEDLELEEKFLPQLWF
jgi:hypothetical protein